MRDLSDLLTVVADDINDYFLSEAERAAMPSSTLSDSDRLETLSLLNTEGSRAVFSVMFTDLRKEIPLNAVSMSVLLFLSTASRKVTGTEIKTACHLNNSQMFDKSGVTLKEKQRFHPNRRRIAC